MRSTVDVVIPCYNYGKFLSECVESVLSQDGVDVRILIIDDCSPDNTQEIGSDLAFRNEQVEFRRHVNNKGHIDTYNEGIEWACSDFFLLLSADDYLLPGALYHATKVMSEHADISFVFGNAVVLSDDGSQINSEPFGGSATAPPLLLRCDEFVQALKGRNIVPTPTAVVRTSAQKRAGGYRKDLPHSGDLAMWLLLAAQGPVGFVNEPQAVYRVHAQNMSRAYSSVWLPDIEQRLAAFEHFLNLSGSQLPNVEATRGVLTRALAREALSHACSAFNEGDTNISLALEKLARKLDSNIRLSPAWLRLAVRRALGQKAWRMARALKAAAYRPHHRGHGNSA
ncbi:glycosyltransferase [Rhizobium sp. NPDC090275]|uniref:glycosyltransferase n=1 Tax=Rhizobium sp. NPDC090275 TaxID=3364498 RepID=UPI00383BEDD6